MLKGTSTMSTLSTGFRYFVHMVSNDQQRLDYLVLNDKLDRLLEVASGDERALHVSTDRVLDVDKDAVVGLVQRVAVLALERDLERHLGRPRGQLAVWGDLKLRVDELHRLERVVERLKHAHALGAQLQVDRPLDREHDPAMREVALAGHHHNARELFLFFFVCVKGGEGDKQITRDKKHDAKTDVRPRGRRGPRA